MVRLLLHRRDLQVLRPLGYVDVTLHNPALRAGDIRNAGHGRKTPDYRNGNAWTAGRSNGTGSNFKSHEYAFRVFAIVPKWPAAAQSWGGGADASSPKSENANGDVLACLASGSRKLIAW